MDEEKNSLQTNVLDVDLDAIVAEGKRKSKKKRRNLVIAAVALIAAAIAVFLIYQHNENTKREAAYQEALAVQESGDYEQAEELFKALGNYKDSATMAQDCYTLNELQTLYTAMNTVREGDSKLVNIVSSVIKSVDALNDATYLMQTSYDTPISYLYEGKGYQRQKSPCSMWDAYEIAGKVRSAKVYQDGSGWYVVYVPILSEANAQTFVDSLETFDKLFQSIDELMGNSENLSALIGNPENVSTRYQEVQSKLQEAYEALKEYHSFVANAPTDCKNYSTLAIEKRDAVTNSLKEAREIEPEIANKPQ